MISGQTQSLSLYTTRSLISFVLSFLILLLYFSLMKPDYVKNTSSEASFPKGKDELSIRLIIIYALLFSSAIALGFMAVDVIYHYYLHQ